MSQEKAPEPKADPALIRQLDATIQSELKLNFRLGRIDQCDALYLLINHLPEWNTGGEKFVMDMVHAAFEVAREKGRVT